MLKSYEVTNFKSFKNHTKFDLEQTNYKMLSETNQHENILKGLMFVGANASGKSNSIIAIKFLLDFLFGKNEINIDTYVCMFSNNPIMRLKYTFEIESEEIIYEIEYQRIDRKMREELKVDGEEYLSRDGSVAQVQFTETQIYTDIPKETLFLRDIYFNTKFRGQKVLQRWFEFLSHSVYVDLYSREAVQYGNKNLSLKSYIEENREKEINHFFDEYNFDQNIEYDEKASGNFVTVESPEKMIFFKRKGIDEPIPFEWESLGNRTLLQLLPAFFYCIKEGGILLLDEFSSGFHNDLEELLIRYFMKKERIHS